jgi:hypothetical protein
MFLERVQKVAGIEAPIQQPPLGEKGDEIRPSELQKLPSEEDSGREASK